VSHTFALGRRFYCVYGNTVNTAARMMLYAQHGNVCVSRDFARQAAEAGLPKQALLVSRGVVEIKGKGPMEIYDIFRGSVVAAFALPMNNTAIQSQLQAHSGLIEEEEVVAAPLTARSAASKRAAQKYLTAAPEYATQSLTHAKPVAAREDSVSLVRSPSDISKNSPHMRKQNSKWIERWDRNHGISTWG
jgi:hypothetical protein